MQKKTDEKFCAYRNQWELIFTEVSLKNKWVKLTKKNEDLREGKKHYFDVRSVFYHRFMAHPTVALFQPSPIL